MHSTRVSVVRCQGGVKNRQRRNPTACQPELLATHIASPTPVTRPRSKGNERNEVCKITGCGGVSRQGVVIQLQVLSLGVHNRNQWPGYFAPVRHLGSRPVLVLLAHERAFLICRPNARRGGREALHAKQAGCRDPVHGASHSSFLARTSHSTASTGASAIRIQGHVTNHPLANPEPLFNGAGAGWIAAG